MANSINVSMRNYIVSNGSAVTPTYLTEIRDQYSFVEYDDPRVYRYVSRYAPYRQIIGTNDNQKYLETFNDTEIDSSDQDTYYTVDIRTKNRLDIIAAEKYGFPTYWWVIAHANNIIDPFDIPYGTILRIPPLKSLYTSTGVMNRVY